MITYALPPEHSGASIQAIRLADQLTINGVKVSFLSPVTKNDKTLINDSHYKNYYVKRIFKGSKIAKLIAPAKILIYLMSKHNRYDIIHVHGAGYLAFLSIISSFVTRKKVVIKMTMLGEDDPESIRKSLFGQFKLFLLKKADKYIATTNSFYDSCINSNIQSDKIHIFPNGVDTQLFKPVNDLEKRLLRKKNSLPNNKKIFAYAGVFRPEKGYDFLLDVFEKANQNGDDYLLILISPIELWLEKEERIYVKKVLQRIDKLKDLGMVMYIGGTDKVYEYFACSDFFISASIREGLPNVLLEAMSSGLPPIVHKIPGVHEEFDNNVDGFFLDKREESFFLSKMNQIVQDENLYQSISINARKKVLDEYSIFSLADKYNALYTEMIPKKR